MINNIVWILHVEYESDPIKGVFGSERLGKEALRLYNHAQKGNSNKGSAQLIQVDVFNEGDE